MTDEFGNIAYQLRSIASSLITHQASDNTPSFDGMERSITPWLEELYKLKHVDIGMDQVKENGVLLLRSFVKRKAGNNLVGFGKRIGRWFWFRGGTPAGTQCVN